MQIRFKLNIFFKNKFTLSIITYPIIYFIVLGSSSINCTVCASETLFLSPQNSCISASSCSASLVGVLAADS